jgi:hypothetical protein
MTDRALVRTGILAALLACASACGGGSGATNHSSTPHAAAAPPACDLLSESAAQEALGLTLELSVEDGGTSCRYLVPGALYRDVNWAQLTTKYQSVSQAVTATKAQLASASWEPAQSPAGLGAEAQLLAGHSDGHDNQGTAVQIDEFLVAWKSSGGTVAALLISELAEDASKDRAVTAASSAYQAGEGTSATKAASASSPTAADTSDNAAASGGPWTLAGSCPDAAALSSALGFSVKSVSPQDGVACQYHAVSRDVGLDLYTADSLSEERLTLDAAHGGIEKLSSMGPNVEEAYGNGNFFNICSISAPWSTDGGGIVAEAKDASMQPIDGKALCPGAMALFTQGATSAS